jgi:hypothetical protein
MHRILTSFLGTTAVILARQFEPSGYGQTLVAVGGVILLMGAIWP